MDRENHEKNDLPNLSGRNVRDDRIGSRSRSEKTEIRLTDLHTSFRVAVSNWRVIFAVSETFLRRFSRPTKSDGCVCLRFGTLSTIRGMRLTQGLPYMMSALKGGGGVQNKLNLRTNSMYINIGKRRGRVNKSYKCVDVIYGSPPYKQIDGT